MPQASALLNAYDRQELAFKNSLAGSNPGFESGVTQWTASGGTFVSNSGTQIVPQSKQFATWDSNAAGQTLQTAAVTVPASGNCEFGIWIAVPSGTATHTITVTDGTNDLITAWTITTNTVAVRHTVNFPCPSSGTVRGKLTSVASNEPSISIDDGYLGRATNVAAVQTTTEWQSFNTTGIFAGFTPGVSTAYGKYRQSGNMVEGWIEAQFGATQTAGTSLVITLPFPVDGSSFVSASTKRIKYGDVKIAISGSRFTGQMIADSSTDGLQSFTLIWETASGTVNSDTTWTYNNIATINSGDGFRVDFKYPVKGWSATGTVVMPDAQGLSWSGTHASTCIWTTTSSSYADPADDASCTLSERTNRNFGTVVTYGAAKPGITFTPRKSGTYFVCARSALYNSTTNGHSTMSLSTTGGTSATIANGGVRQGTSGGSNDEKSVTLCGLVNLTSTTSTTVRLQIAASIGTTTLADLSSGGSSVEWSIFNVDQPVQAILANSVSTANSNGDRIHRSFINCDGSSAVTSTNESSTSVGNISAGTCTVTFPAYSSAPQCTASIQNCAAPSGSGCFERFSSATTTTTASVKCQSDAGSDCTSSDFYLICIGPR